jgi:hypothetical protein
MAEIAMAVNSLSYNQLVERIITYKASEDSVLLSQVSITFLKLGTGIDRVAEPESQNLFLKGSAAFI